MRKEEPANREGPFSKVTSVLAESKGRAASTRFPPGDFYIVQANQANSTPVLEAAHIPPPHTHTSVPASVPGLLTTSSNWLISPRLSWSQLHCLSWASVGREAKNQEEKKTLSSHYSSSFPYSLPRPSQAPLPCLFLPHVLYLKTLFITILPFMWREPLASFQ